MRLRGTGRCIVDGLIRGKEWNAMKAEISAESETLKLFDVTQMLDPLTGETVCWVIFPRDSEELHADT
jgi:hypothetical protein